MVNTLDTADHGRPVLDFVPAAVVFALDDTFYPTADYVRSGAQIIARMLEKRFGWPWRESCDTLLSLSVATPRPDDMIRALLALHDMADIRLLSRLLHLWRNHVPDIVPFAGVEATLAHLEQRGIKTGLVAGGRPEVAMNKLRALGLADRLDRVTLPKELGLCPKRGQALDATAKALGVSVDGCLLVSGQPSRDGVAASACKMPFLAIGDQPVPAGLPCVGRIEWFSELIDIV